MHRGLNDKNNETRVREEAERSKRDVSERKDDSDPNADPSTGKGDGVPDKARQRDPDR